MMRGKALLLVLAVVLGACTLSACSGEEAKPEEKSSGQNKESSADLSQFASDDRSIWRDSWSGKMEDGKDFGIKMNALIELPKLSHMSAIEVKKYTFDNEHKKKLTESILETDICHYDPEKLPKSELESMLSGAESGVTYYEEQLKGLEEEKNLNENQQSQQKEARELLEKLKGDVKKYRNLLKKAPKDFQQVQDGEYEGSRFLGEWGGKKFILEYNTGDGQRTAIYLEPYDMDEFFPDRMKGKGGYYYQGDAGGQTENECELSKEEAQKQVEEFLEKTGFTDLVQEEQGVLLWNVWNDPGAPRDTPDDTFANGWVFTYSLGVDGFSLLSYDSEAEYQTAAGKLSYVGYPLNCQIRVYISDKGIVEATWENPIVEVSVTKDVKLLPVENIKSILKKDIGAYVEFLTKSGFFAGMEPSVSFNRMELIYYRVADPENEERFTYIPAWKFRSNTGSLPLFLVVNAMDGSIISDWDSIWKIAPPEGAE